MNHKVLVVAAHPDDEILGCGGTLIQHAQKNDEVRILIMAEGVTSREDMRNVESHERELELLHRNSKKAAEIMGASDVTLCGFPDNRMDQIDLLDVVKKIERVVEEFNPDLVYTHHAADLNIDHQITHDAVITACRPLPGSSVKTLLFFETLSSTEWQMADADKIFCPNWFVDIGETLQKKLKALHCYDSEMRDFPHPRSYENVKNLAAYRGMMVGCEYAEAFSLGRKILLG